jgi:pyridoxamine 5'-phosphate oxidase
MSEQRATGEQRVSYEKGALDESTVSLDPFAQFDLWYEDAGRADGVGERAAMSVATAGADGVPSLRIVLLRGVDARGFVFFTNYESHKGRDLAANPHAALLFFWEPLERQIRIEGRVEKIDGAESDAYFARRPRGHRLSAWASAQSSTIPDRATVERRMAAEDVRFAGSDVPRPEYWGGYRVVPKTFEFWQGRRNRVHDRIAYARAGGAGAWTIARLAP